MFKHQDKLRLIYRSMFVVSILLLTVPTLIVLFGSISPFWFKLLNTLGLIIAAIRIILSTMATMAIIATKGVATEEKKGIDKEAKILFFLVILLQAINMMFVQIS